MYNRDVTTLSRDTHPKMEEMQLDLLRQAKPWRKLEIVAQLSENVRRLTFLGLQQRFPHESEENLRRRLAALLYGPDLAVKVYGLVENE